MRVLAGLFVLLFSQSVLAQNCAADSHWVRAYHRRAYYRATGVFVSASSVSAHCQKNSATYDYWKDKLKNDRPEEWPNKNERTKPWTAEESERTIEALSELPTELFGSYIKGIYRMDKSKDYPNPGSSTEGYISLYDSAFGSAKNPSLARVLGHELAHEVYRNLGKDDSIGYRLATNWQNNGSDLSPDWKNRRTPDQYIRPEASEDPDEDFAENVEAFLFEPTTLNKKVHYAYVWIKNNFGDKFKIGMKGTEQ